MTDEKPSTQVEKAPPVAERTPGWLERRLSGLYAWRDAVKKHPVWGTGFALLVLLAGIVGNILIGNAKRWYFGPDEFLVQMANTQKQEFAALKENLGRLRGSITSDDRAAFNSVQSAVKSLEGTNTQLIAQLMLAKRENDALRTASEHDGRVSGGYDFLLSEHGGMRLDAQNVLGVSSVASYFVSVSLTSVSGETISEDLRSGQSIPFRSAKGQSCRVSLLSIQDSEPGTASFALGCA